MLIALVSFPCLAVRMERASKEGFSFSGMSCQFFAGMENSMFFCQRDQFFSVQRNNVSPSISTVKGNSAAPTLVHLVPKTLSIPVGCSKNSPARTEIVAQDVLRRQ